VTTVIPADAARVAAAQKVIDGLRPEIRVGAGIAIGDRSSFDVHDPATGEVIGSVADAGLDVAAAAVDVAYAAGREWAQASPRHRSDVLRHAYDLMIERAEDFALLITREMGKPLAEARGEVTYATDFVRWFADEAIRPGGSYRMSPYGDSRIASTRSPVGVCLLITPWNFPMAMAARKIAPALAAGCSVILKPAALTPLTSLLFADVLRTAGVPDGVVNVVTTSNSSALSTAVMADPRVRKVSFTGSTPVGMKLVEQGAKNLLRTSMELGGNAPFLIFDDADLERTVAGALVAKLRNGGQSCIAANRFLVQAGIADEFVAEFTRRMSAVTVGHGLGDGVGLGPVIDGRARTGIEELVRGSVAAGAELLSGGSSIDGDGSFFEPTVLDRVAPNSEIARAEIFGPVATITRFETQDEAIAIANDTPFGLASYVFSQDIDRAFGVADRLEAGMVGINQGVVSNVAAPFGGVKHSGLGREGGAEGLEEYQDIRFYNIARR
jgi:succinate-semialdehyde dehydrogenase/glutarate-semialdehyde dehydrogenase